jgi:TrmH family RNA methyltransferase
VKPITSRQNRVVSEYRAVARGGDPERVLLDGVHLVADALAAGCHLERVVVSSERSRDPLVASLMEAAVRAGARAATVSAPVMAAISPVRSPSSMAAIARRPHLQDRVFAGRPPLVVIACDVQDPGNLGAIARVVEAAGASGLVAAGESADPFGWKAVRGSMGSALRLPIAVQPRAEAAVVDARAHGCRIVATVPRGGTSLFEADLTGATALLFGGEGSGLSDSLIHAADSRLTIPMAAPVESLNAAVAVGLVVYHARRQRA